MEADLLMIPVPNEVLRTSGFLPRTEQHDVILKDRHRYKFNFDRVCYVSDVIFGYIRTNHHVLCNVLALTVSSPTQKIHKQQQINSTLGMELQPLNNMKQR